MQEEQERGRLWMASVGLWNGSQTVGAGRLLYKRVMRHALAFGVSGGTAWGQIEGGRLNERFWSVESEVASNELPMWLEFVDDADRIRSWLPMLVAQVKHSGVVMVRSLKAHNWRNQPPGGGGKGTMSKNAESSGAEDVRLSAAPGLHVQVLTVERQKRNGKPLYQAVAEFLRERNVLWLSTTRGVSGFGSSRVVHNPAWLWRGEEAPIVMDIVDEAEKLAPIVQDLVQFVGPAALVASSEVTLYNV